MNKYNPKYDPLTLENPGENQAYAPTYWAGTVEDIYPGDNGILNEQITTDVVVIGSGFTGLATALFLAKEHGIKATILEANQLSWGCTSRNGGQGQNASGRLYRSQWIKKYGIDTALKLHKEILDGYKLFKSLVINNGIECDPQYGGHLLLAHNKAKLDWLNKETEIMSKYFNYETKILSVEDLKRDYLWDRDSVGGQHEECGISVHPLKLAYGYAKLAMKHGVKIHTGSPVLSIDKMNNGKFLVKSPSGSAVTEKVCIATGGYTSTNLHSSVAYRYMPILSNSVVTEPMSDFQIEECMFHTTQAITDTRRLRFYYRKLPDNRLQIGSRSAITGKNAANPKHLKLLTDAISRKFPALSGIKIDYSWWGWVDVSHDMMPRVFKPDPSEEIFYAFGYGGNGVSFSAQAGKRMAEHVAESKKYKEVSSLPIYNSELPTHPMRLFRRLGQRILYKQYAFLDKYR